MSKQLNPGAMGIYYPGNNELDDQPDSPIDFALFGLARQSREFWPGWATPDMDLPILDMGPGAKLVSGAQVLDWPEYDFESPEIVRNSRGSAYRCLLPYPNNSIGGVFAVHVLEHLYDPRPIIAEVARVLAPDCPFNVVVPDADSAVFKQDVDHKTAFCLDTWKTLLDNGGYYDNHSPAGLKLGTNFKFALKEGNEIIVTQLIKVANDG